MKNFLVKEDGNWADEFDLAGFKILKKESLSKVKESLIDGREFPCEIYFGTNEAQEYSSKKEFFADLTIKEITEEEYRLLKKLFPGCDSYAFGTTAIL